MDKQTVIECLKIIAESGKPDKNVRFDSNWKTDKPEKSDIASMLASIFNTK